MTWKLSNLIYIFNASMLSLIRTKMIVFHALLDSAIKKFLLKYKDYLCRKCVPSCVYILVRIYKNVICKNGKYIKKPLADSDIF